MKLLYDVPNGKWFAEEGWSFGSGEPGVYYGARLKIEIQCYQRVFGANSSDPQIGDTWLKYTGFSGKTVGAKLSVDNNFRHWFKGTLAKTVTDGATEIIISLEQDIELIAERGMIFLYNRSGLGVGVSYSGRAEADGGIKFTVENGTSVSGEFSEGAQADVPEALYVEAPMNSSASDPANGYFVFDVVVDSPKLRNKMRYSDSRTADDVKGLELLIFDTKTDATIDSYLCSSFTIKGTIGDSTPVQVTEEKKNQIALYVDSMLAQGLAVQLSTDGVEWADAETVAEENLQNQRFQRFRLREGNGEWCPPCPLIVGPRGEAGSVEVAFSGDSFAPHDGLLDDDIYLHFSFDGGETWSEGIQFRNGPVEEYPPIEEYNPQVSYGVNRMVTFGDPAGTYQAKEAMLPGISPEVAPDRWRLVASPGKQGRSGTPGSGTIFQGTYDPEESYEAGDSVEYNGNLWYCIFPTKGHEPPEFPKKTNLYWTFYLAGGPQGKAGEVFITEVRLLPSDADPLIEELAGSTENRRYYAISLPAAEQGLPGNTPKFNSIEMLEEGDDPEIEATEDSTEEQPVYTIRIPRGPKGRDGSGLTYHQSGSMKERSEYDGAPAGTIYGCTDLLQDENGFFYQNFYQKRTNANGDWSEGMRSYIGRQGEEGRPGKDGKQGPRGENADVKPDRTFTPQEVYKQTLILDGAEPIATVDLYEKDGFGHAAPIGVGADRIEIVTRYDANKTFLIFGPNVDFSLGGRVRYAQGLSGQSEYQMWLGAGHDGTQADYIDWLRGEGLMIPVKEGELDENKLTVRPDRTAVCVIDEEGLEWKFEQAEVCHKDTFCEFDFSGIKARKGVDAIAGEWKLVINSGQGRQGEPGKMAELTISGNETWVINGKDTGTDVRGRGAEIRLGDVRTGEPESNVVITNRGTKYSALFDFTIPRGRTGDTGHGLQFNNTGKLEQRHEHDRANAGFCYLATDRYIDANGHEYNLWYQKRSEAFADWSEGAVLYLGVQGKKGERGEQGPMGENVAVIPDFYFGLNEIADNALILEGTRAIAQVEQRYTEDLTDWHESFVDITKRVTIRTCEDENHTIIYFDEGVDYSSGGRIRFAQGVGGITQYQEYLAQGGTLTYNEWVLAVRNTMEEAPKDGNFYCRQNGKWIAVAVQALGTVTISGTEEYLRTGRVNEAFFLAFDAVASNGSAVSVELKSGTMPEGLELSGNALSGTLTAEGVFELVFSAAAMDAQMEIRVTLTVLEARVMYYGWVNSTAEVDRVSGITADMLNAATVAGADAAAMGQTSLGDAPAGALVFVLLPDGAGLKALKFDGIGGYCEFAEDNGTKITLNNTGYLAYGEFRLVDGETIVKVEVI